MIPSGNVRWDRQSGRLMLAILLLFTAMILAYTGVRTLFVFVVLASGAVVLWTLPLETNLIGYTSTLAFQVFQSVVLFRVAVADFFMLPAAVKTFRDLRGRGELPPASTLTRPLVLLLVVMVMGTVIGVLERGHVGGYVLINKDLGILYLIAGYYAMVRFLQYRNNVERAVRWFIAGVSFANITALGAAVLALSGFHNDLYLTGNLRLYGWMLNPSLFGSVVFTAAMIELGWLALAPLHVPWWRWVNLWLFALSLALTISRGTWIATGAAAAALLSLQVLIAPARPTFSRAAVAAIWALLPALAVGGILRVNVEALIVQDSEEHALALQRRLVDQCLTNPSLDICSSVKIPAGWRAGVRPADPEVLLAPDGMPTGEGTKAGTGNAELLPVPNGMPTANAAWSTLTNARGLQDRFAIIGVAARNYMSSPRRVLTGIGLGTFYDTSAANFGVPLIIHNTFVWFLFEMGPVGLLVVVWIWARTSRNLWRACRAGDWRVPISTGVAAAFVGLTVFCLLNEGFYQRHLWFVFALADTLGGISITSQVMTAAPLGSQGIEGDCA